MASLIDIKFLGDKALQRKLDRLERAVQGQIVRSAMRKAAKPVLAMTKALVPRRTGVNTDPLRAGLGIDPLSGAQKKRGAVGVQITTPSRLELGIPGDEKNFYPVAIELGTVNAPAVPYMRNAMEITRGQATAIAAREIAKGIIRVAKKK